MHRPESRVYTHRGCGGSTVVSGDDYLLLEFPHRSLSGTFCCKCRSFVPLYAVDWDDTGENVDGYRQRLMAATSGWDQVRIGLLGNAVTYRPPPLDGVFGDTTHFHWFGPSEPAPAAPPPVRHVQGTGGLPGEVTALGPAEHMHSPQALMGMFRTIPAYAALESALLINQGSEFTIIPWDAMTEFDPEAGKLTAGEGTYTIDSGVQQRGLLVQKIKDRITNRLLPAALAAVREGGSVDYGAFTFARKGVSHDGKQLSWAEVKQVKFAANPFGGGRTLAVQAKGSTFGSWAKGSVTGLANEFVVVELVRRQLPPDAVLAVI